MKSVLTFTAAALLLVLSVSLLEWKASYRSNPPRRPPGTSTLMQSGSVYYNLTNSLGWLTVERADPDTMLSVRVLSFPWWAPVLASALLLALVVVRIVRRKRVQGFPVTEGRR